MAISVHAVNTEVCKALGLDPMDTRDITLRFVPDDLPQVTVKHILRDEAGEALNTVLRRYVLTPEPEVTP